MPTYNPKQLGEPEVIREISPTVLFAFLQPFEGYLRSRGLVIKKESRIDNTAIEKLVDILTNPTMKTPQSLLNAVFYVEEMATPSAADLLLNAAQQAGMPFDEEGKHSLADIVMQVWLFDSKMVETQHAWHTWKTPRRMECWPPPPFDPPGEPLPYVPPPDPPGSSSEPRPDWWPEDWVWPPVPEPPIEVLVPPPLPNIIWPRLPPHHPYHLPPGYHWPDNLPPGHPGHDVKPPKPPGGSGDAGSEGSGDEAGSSDSEGC